MEGVGLLIYILAAIIVPVNPYDTQNAEIYEQEKDGSRPNGISTERIILGIGLFLVAIGAVALVKEVFPAGWGFIKDMTWPALLIVLGSIIIVSSLRKK